MKRYDREKRKYISEEEYQEGKKKRELCRGGKPHDYILVLPYHARHTDSVLGIDIAEEYYRIIDEFEDLLDKREERLKAIGVTEGFYRSSIRREREYVCSVCQKKHFESFTSN